MATKNSKAACVFQDMKESGEGHTATAKLSARSNVIGDTIKIEVENRIIEINYRALEDLMEKARAAK